MRTGYSTRVSGERRDPSDDGTLARRIAAAAPGRAADDEAELYRRMAPRIRLYGLKHLREPQAAADLVHQVFLLLLERLRRGEVREPDRLGSFALGICRMVVLDLRRAAQRQERLLQTFAADLSIADVGVAPRFDHGRILHCLELLSERERAVLVRTFYDDCPARQVASELGLSEGNVRVIRHRGLERLRLCVTRGETA